MSDTSDPVASPSLADALDAADRELGAVDSGLSGDSAPGYAGESCIQFVLGGIRAAVPLVHAAEIGRDPRFTPLPNLPAWLLGVSNVRGEIVSMVDLAAFLGLDRPRLLRKRRFIVVRNPEMRVGLVVDRILGIRSLDVAKRTESAEEHAAWHRYVREELPLADGVLHMIDVPRLLASPEMNAFHPE